MVVTGLRFRSASAHASNRLPGKLPMPGRYYYHYQCYGYASPLCPKICCEPANQFPNSGDAPGVVRGSQD